MKDSVDIPSPSDSAKPSSKKVIQKTEEGYFIRMNVPASQFSDRKPRRLEAHLNERILNSLAEGMQAVLSYGDNVAGKGIAIYPNSDDPNRNILTDDQGVSSVADLASQADVTKNSMKLRFWNAHASDNIITVSLKPQELGIKCELDALRDIRPPVFEHGTNDQMGEVCRHIVSRVVSSSDRDKAAFIYQMNRSIFDGDFERAIQIIRSGKLDGAKIFFDTLSSDFNYPIPKLFYGNRYGKGSSHNRDEEHVNASIELIDACAEHGLMDDGFRNLFIEPRDEIFHYALDRLMEHRPQDVRQDAIDQALMQALHDVIRHDVPGKLCDVKGRLEHCQGFGWAPDRRMIHQMLRVTMKPADPERRSNQTVFFGWMFSQGALMRNSAVYGGTFNLMRQAIDEQQEEIALLMLEYGESFTAEDIDKVREKMPKLASAMEFRRLGSQIQSAAAVSERAPGSRLHRSMGV